MSISVNQISSHSFSFNTNCEGQVFASVLKSKIIFFGCTVENANFPEVLSEILKKLLNKTAKKLTEVQKKDYQNVKSFHINDLLDKIESLIYNPKYNRTEVIKELNNCFIELVSKVDDKERNVVDRIIYSIENSGNLRTQIRKFLVKSVTLEEAKSDFIHKFLTRSSGTNVKELFFSVFKDFIIDSSVVDREFNDYQTKMNESTEAVIKNSISRFLSSLEGVIKDEFCWILLNKKNLQNLTEVRMTEYVKLNPFYAVPASKGKYQITQLMAVDSGYCIVIYPEHEERTNSQMSLIFYYPDNVFCQVPFGKIRVASGLTTSRIVIIQNYKERVLDLDSNKYKEILVTKVLKARIANNKIVVYKERSLQMEPVPVIDVAYLTNVKTTLFFTEDGKYYLYKKKIVTLIDYSFVYSIIAFNQVAFVVSQNTIEIISDDFTVVNSISIDNYPQIKVSGFFQVALVKKTVLILSVQQGNTINYIKIKLTEEVADAIRCKRLSIGNVIGGITGRLSITYDNFKKPSSLVSMEVINMFKIYKESSQAEIEENKSPDQVDFGGFTEEKRGQEDLEFSGARTEHFTGVNTENIFGYQEYKNNVFQVEEQKTQKNTFKDDTS